MKTAYVGEFRTPITVGDQYESRNGSYRQVVTVHDFPTPHIVRYSSIGHGSWGHTTVSENEARIEDFACWFLWDQFSRKVTA